MIEEKAKDRWVFAAAVIALAVCLWLGWSGFDPNVPQDVVRATIHSAPRTIAQLLVQFVAPVAVIALLFRHAVARRRVGADRV